MADRKLSPGEIYAEALKTLPAEDIDHHNSDLYLKRTPAAETISDALEKYRESVEHYGVTVSKNALANKVEVSA